MGALGLSADARAWQPSATEQYSSVVPHQPCDEQHDPLPHVVSLTYSVPKSRPQRLSDRMPIQIQTAAQRPVRGAREWRWRRVNDWAGMALRTVLLSVIVVPYEEDEGDKRADEPGDEVARALARPRLPHVAAQAGLDAARGEGVHRIGRGRV